MASHASPPPPAFSTLSHHCTTGEWRRVAESWAPSGGLVDVVYARTPRPGHAVTLEELVDWVLSISVVAARPPAAVAATATAVRAVMAEEDAAGRVAWTDRPRADGRSDRVVVMPMYTETWIARKAA
jgi:hypothetical protein